MRSFTIDKYTTIADKTMPFIIAEIGHNHGGSIDHCKQLIDLAAQSGANAIKLQKRSNKTLYTQELFKSPYKNKNSYGDTYGAHREMLEFNEDAYIELKKYTNGLGLYFFATPFDFESVDFLEEIGVPFYKIQSGDIYNLPLVERIADTGKPIIMSTGGAEMDDIKRATDVLDASKSEYALLHCVSLYPVHSQDLRMYMIEELAHRYENRIIGFSSHYDGILGPLIAFLYGARIIEVHFTDSRSNKGSDHSFSLTPQGLTELTHYISEIRLMWTKEPGESRKNERSAIKKLMKSMYFKYALKAGHHVTMADIAIKSPYQEEGISIYLLPKVINTTLRVDVKEDQLINKEIYLELTI